MGEEWRIEKRGEVGSGLSLSLCLFVLLVVVALLLLCCDMIRTSFSSINPTWDTFEKGQRGACPPRRSL